MKRWIVLMVLLMLYGCRTSYLPQEIPRAQLCASAFGGLATRLLEIEFEGCSVKALAEGDAIDAYWRLGEPLHCGSEDLGLAMLDSGMARIYLLVVPKEEQSKRWFEKAYVFVRLWPECQGSEGFYYRADILFCRVGESGEEITVEFRRNQKLNFGNVVVTSIY